MYLAFVSRSQSRCGKMCVFRMSLQGDVMSDYVMCPFTSWSGMHHIHEWRNLGLWDPGFTLRCWGCALFLIGMSNLTSMSREFHLLSGNSDPVADLCSGRLLGRSHKRCALKSPHVIYAMEHLSPDVGLSVLYKWCAGLCIDSCS